MSKYISTDNFKDMDELLEKHKLKHFDELIGIEKIKEIDTICNQSIPNIDYKTIGITEENLQDVGIDLTLHSMDDTISTSNVQRQEKSDKRIKRSPPTHTRTSLI